MKIKSKQSNIKVAIASAIMVGSVSFSSAGYAATLTVNAVIGEACVIDASTTMSFSGYNATTTHAAGEGGVNLVKSANIGSLCNAGTTALINMNKGLHGAGTDAAPTRKLATADANAPKLNYNLYKDDGYNYIFGIGGNGGATDEGGLSLVADGNSNNVTVYGSIPKGQLVPTGTYTDTINVTITY